MKAIQYTIRNVPPKLDQALRKRAQITGKSLNTVVIEDIASQYNINLASTDDASDSLDWFIGSGPLDDDVLNAIEEDSINQKELTKKELGIKD